MTTELEEILILFKKEELVIAQQGYWETLGNTEYMDTVVEYNDRYYEIVQQRHGSWDDGYHYRTPSICEVEKKECTINYNEWIPVE